MMGIPPLTVIFLLMMIVTSIWHSFVDIPRRRRKLANERVNEKFIKSWF
jgi:hypothetical protein